LLAWLIGWLIGDSANAWVWLYYLPAPIVAPLGLAWCWWSRRSAPRTLHRITLAIALFAVFKVGVLDTCWHRAAAPSPEALRVVHWNVAHARFGRFPILSVLKGDQPDLVALSESTYANALAWEVQHDLGLAHTFQDQGMTLLSRHPFETRGTIPMPNGRAWWARVATPRGPLDVVLVDLISHPRLNRKVPLDRLAAWVTQHEPGIPLLILGDFNTPRDARAFRPLRAQLQHAYESAGRGWPYSWPLPYPCYSLDHAWHSTELRITNYRLRAARVSDHLRQVLDVEMP
jgi:endonuclease/exonuclease/phosphatase family metal-dependent hydrolase